MAVSRPLPGPETRTSILRRPCSWAIRDALSAATWAANGVPLRLPLKFALPALDQEITFPWGSVIVMSVLLNEALMNAIPVGMFFFSFALPFCTAFLAIVSVFGLRPSVFGFGL